MRCIQARRFINHWRHTEINLLSLLNGTENSKDGMQGSKNKEGGMQGYNRKLEYKAKKRQVDPVKVKSIDEPVIKQSNRFDVLVSDDDEMVKKSSAEISSNDIAKAVRWKLNDAKCKPFVSALHNSKRPDIFISSDMDGMVTDNGVSMKEDMHIDGSKTKQQTVIDESIGANDTIFYDNFFLLEQERKEAVMGFIEKRRIPSPDDVADWNFVQSKFFFRMCEVHNFINGLTCIDFCEEDDEVDLEDDETRLFMKIDSGTTQALGGPSCSKV